MHVLLFIVVLWCTWQLFEAMNHLRQQMDQQKLEFDEERERLHAKMSATFDWFSLLVTFRQWRILKGDFEKDGFWKAGWISRFGAEPPEAEQFCLSDSQRFPV